MNIEIFSANTGIETCFNAVEKSRNYTVTYHPPKKLIKIINTIGPGTLVYLDIARFSDREKRTILGLLSQKTDFSYGIIDTGAQVDDITGLFYRNAVDYIGEKQFNEGISLKRIKQTVGFIEKLSGIRYEKNQGKGEESEISLSGRDWKSVKPGNEYTFCFMFIELDNQDELKLNYGSDKLKEFTTAFHDDIMEYVSDIHGRTWIWTDFGGIILIPFDGKNCEAIITCFELILNRNIISVEDYNYNRILSYRIVLHIDNTVYKPVGETGDIVSDSINTVFHLGHQFAEPGGLFMTEEMFEFIPEGLEDYFVDFGEFEGKKIKIMITPFYM
jgi:hypothetical protein